MSLAVRENTSTLIKPEVLNLASRVLSSGETSNAEEIIELTFSSDKSNQKKAGVLLAQLLPRKPKRPLSYVNDEVSQGPFMGTRYVVHYLCAFTNFLLDCLAKDVGGFKAYVPFGGTLKKLKGKIPEGLYKNLYDYNQIFYRPAKHDYDLYNTDDHLFSLKDAIYCCFITMKLKDEILTLSQRAKSHVEGGYDSIKEKI